MLRQEHLQRVQLLRYPFDVIQSVYPDDNLAPAEPLLQALQSLLDSISPKTIDELHGFDPDGICPNLSISTLELNPVWHGFQAENTGAGGEEVTGVVVCMEAGHILSKESEVLKADIPNEIAL